jgi:hypothetical protein
MKDKINQINELDQRIKQLKDFLWICENGHGESSYSEKDRPKFDRFSKLELETYRWTGSDNPRYSKHISNDEDIALLVDCFVENLRVLIKKHEAELNALIV